jgi:protein-S-isoprenylcysteine O-methyltransferase Ste14
LAVAAALAQRAFTGATPRPGTGRVVLACTLSVASISLAGATAGQFRRQDTTVDPVHPSRASALVTTGANSFTRNPMYVGLAGLLVAHAAWRGSWRALVPVAGFVGLMDRLQIQAEESALAEKFGTSYAAYRAATPRWLDRRSFSR